MTDNNKPTNATGEDIQNINSDTIGELSKYGN